MSRGSISLSDRTRAAAWLSPLTSAAVMNTRRGRVRGRAASPSPPVPPVCVSPEWARMGPWTPTATTGDVKEGRERSEVSVQRSEIRRSFVRPTAPEKRARSLREELPDRVDRLLPLDGGDGLQQGDVLWADLDAVAGLAAVGDAPFAHEDF